jgi:hypothetical protein
LGADGKFTLSHGRGIGSDAVYPIDFRRVMSEESFPKGELSTPGRENPWCSTTVHKNALALGRTFAVLPSRGSRGLPFHQSDKPRLIRESL